MSEILSADQLRHHHRFDEGNPLAERNTRWAVYLTLIMMVAEISGGIIYNSMALLADGWHMATHVAAFLITLYAYRYSREHEKDRNYAFGTGKVGVLGGFASAMALAVVAFFMLMESVHRLVDPQVIQFNAAIGVAVIGLVVNIVSAVLLKDNHQVTVYDNLIYNQLSLLNVCNDKDFHFLYGDVRDYTKLNNYVDKFSGY